MLLAGSRLIDAPVMGLQTGGELARTTRPVIDPHTLEIIAYELAGPLLDAQPSLLRIVDVREFSDIGIIVDSSDEFVALGDVIKLDAIYNLHFDPIGMTVIDEKRRKLGKVEGYTIDTGGFIIQQLEIKRPLFKSLNDTQLLVHRTQITEINDSHIVVHSEAEHVAPSTSSVRANYINPFRKHPRAQAEHSERQ